MFYKAFILYLSRFPASLEMENVSLWQLLSVMQTGQLASKIISHFKHEEVYKITIVLFYLHINFNEEMPRLFSKS